MVTATATLILEAVDRDGLLLVHDTELPSVTGLVAGEPVAGSWWSHPLANDIFNSLCEIEDQLLTLKLISRKQTLVAARLWPDIVALGRERADWQLRGLSSDAEELLVLVDAADHGLVVERVQRKTARLLEERLLVQATDQHTPSGHHVKAYSSWRRWATQNNVVDDRDAAEARCAVELVVSSWPTAAGRAKRLLPW